MQNVKKTQQKSLHERQDTKKAYQSETSQERSLLLWKIQAAISSVSIKNTNKEKSNSR